MKTSNYFILIISFIVFSSLSCMQGAPTDRTQLMNFLLLMPYTKSINFINIDSQDHSGNTALMIAAERNPGITSLLINHGANIFLRNNKGQTAYDILCETNYNETLAAVFTQKRKDVLIRAMEQDFWIKKNQAMQKIMNDINGS